MTSPWTLIACLASLQLVNCQRAPLDCSKLLVRADRCMSRAVFVGIKQFVIPKSIEQLEEFHCRRIRSDIRCLINYRVCLKEFPKMFYELVIRNLKNHVVKTLCGTDSGKKELMANLQCFDDHRLRELHKILNHLINVLDYVRNDVSDDQQIGGLCCSYRHLVDYGKKAVDKLCPDHPSTGQFVADLVDGLINEASDLVCGQHSSIELCNSKLPLEMSMIRNITSRPSKATGTSPLIPMIEIAKKLSSVFTTGDARNSN